MPYKVKRKQGGLCGKAWPWLGLGTGVDMNGALGPETLEGAGTCEGRVLEVWGMDQADWAGVFSGVRVHKVSAISFTDSLFFISSSRAALAHPGNYRLDFALDLSRVVYLPLLPLS